MPLVGRITFRS